MGEADEAKLYVGNLSYQTREDDLRDMFEKYGDISEVIVIRERDGGERSKGFGFVTFKDVNDAKDAIKGLDQKELDGRSLTVNQSRPRESRSYGGGGGGRRDYGGGGGGGGRRDYGGGGGGGSRRYDSGGRSDRYSSGGGQRYR